MMARFQYLAEVIPAVHTANSLITHAKLTVHAAAIAGPSLRYPVASKPGRAEQSWVTITVSGTGKGTSSESASRELQDIAASFRVLPSRASTASTMWL